jgi:hypothetical protein
MQVKVMIQKCVKESGSNLVESAVNDIRSEVKKIRDFLGTEAVKVGFSYGAKWKIFTKNETSAKFRTSELDIGNNTVVWLEASVTWLHGSTSNEEITNAVSKS